jgi:hypothetical protein
LVSFDVLVEGIVVAAEKGPINVLTEITTEKDYVSVFGYPTDTNYRHFFTATAFLGGSNKLQVVRTEDKDVQVAGRTVLASSSSTSFALEVAGYDDDNVFGWQNLIPSGIGLSKAIINATNFQVNTGILTVDFDFMCYVA